MSAEPGGRHTDREGTVEPAGPGPAPSAGASPEPAGGASSRPAAPRRSSFWRELPVILVVALLLSLVIKTFVVQAFFIPSTSMEPTLEVGDRVFVSKFTTRFGEVQRGDVVVFRDPGGWLPDEPEVDSGGPVRDALRDALVFVGLAPSSTGEDLIKRVVGVAGDTVACCDDQGRVTVNGEPLEEDYLFGDDPASDLEFQVEVPAGSVWVMGDHRQVSQDSRYHQDDPRGGMVPLDQVIGRAFVLVWPVDRWTGLGRPDAYDDIPAP